MADGDTAIYAARNESARGKEFTLDEKIKKKIPARICREKLIIDIPYEILYAILVKAGVIEFKDDSQVLSVEVDKEYDSIYVKINGTGYARNINHNISHMKLTKWIEENIRGVKADNRGDVHNQVTFTDDELRNFRVYNTDGTIGRIERTPDPIENYRTEPEPSWSGGLTQSPDTNGHR